MALLEAREVSKVFWPGEAARQAPVVALQDVSFQVGEGEFVCVLGPNGCGKTTLVRILAGLIPPDRGEVRLGGAPVTGPPPDQAIVFQHYGLFPWRTVMGNVELALELAGVPKAERRERCRRYIDLVGLTGFDAHYPHQLSGGMQQRTALARALSKEPRLLLLDEPFGHLDEQTREALQDELGRIWAGLRMTVVFVTHTVEEALVLADRILLFSPRPGRLREEIKVTLRRPRTAVELDASPEFHRLRSAIRGILRAA
ncbi:MAG: ABC transporter ATP-binding protein [Candidatus Rokuibacteriota bacterium]